MSQAACLIQHALTKAKQELEWMGVIGNDDHVRGVAAARLRFASLMQPHDATLLSEMARELERSNSVVCTYCGAVHAA